MYYIIALVIIELILLVTNVTWGHFLIGWDNIMPEFNLGLNFLRPLFGVWLEYRGLGLLDGMSHIATLVHTIYIALFSLVLPQWLVRYVFIHLTHLIGGIGFFFLADNLVKNKKAAFIGGLFYMFNIGIIQMYYAPLEVFATQFAALPILALLITKSLQSPSKRNLLLLFIASIATTPQGFVPTVFVAFLILVFALSLFHFLQTKNFKHILLVGIVIFAANAFWLLPFTYSSLQNTTVIKQARINEYSSEEILYRNKARGDIESVFSLKGFMIDSIDYNPAENEDTFFMDVWRNHTGSILYKLIYLPILLLGLLGLVRIVQKGRKEFFPYVFTFVVGFVVLANNTIVLEQLNNIFRTLMPIFAEAFRFPFTKFITLFVFSFALFVSVGVAFLFNRVKTRQIIIFAFLLFSLSFLSYPAFTGQFTSPLLRLAVPTDYTQLFSYLNTIDQNERIALLPAHTFWNWQYRSWGQWGSGFIFYGIPQALMERAFDPWSNYNEQFYNEIADSINSKNEEALTRVLDKYDIGYLLLDSSIINTVSKKPINYDSLRQFIEATPGITDKQAFGRLLLYQTSFGKRKMYTLAKDTTPIVAPNFMYNRLDPSFNLVGNYVAGKESTDNLPLIASFSTEKLQEDLEFEAHQQDDAIVIAPKKVFLTRVENALLSIPSLFANEYLVPIDVTLENGVIKLTPLYPKVFINGNQVAINDTPIEIRPKLVKKPTTITFVDIKYQVPLSTNKVKSYLINPFINTLKLSDGKNEELIFIDTQNIKHDPISVNVGTTDVKDVKDVKIIVDKISSPFALVDGIANKNYEVIKTADALSPFGNKTVKRVEENASGVTLTAIGNTSEISFYKDNLFHQASYILFANASYKSGLPINFYVDNPYQERSELETKLSKKKRENVIVIPPTEDFFHGYGMHFIAKSVGIESAQSTIEDVDIYPFPLRTLEQTRLISSGLAGRPTQMSVKNPLVYTKLNPSLYQLTTPNQNSYLVLSQAYNSGWKVYQIRNYESGIMNYAKLALPFFFGEELKDHVLVNNWANGWDLATNNNQGQMTILIVFLPQYLEYFGFGILIITAAVFLLKKNLRG